MDEGGRSRSIFGICPRKNMVEWSGQYVSESEKMNLANSRMDD